jgi:hypothetical protein
MDKPFTMADWKDKIKKQKEINNLNKESNKSDLLKKESGSSRTISPDDLK